MEGSTARVTFSKPNTLVSYRRRTSSAVASSTAPSRPKRRCTDAASAAELGSLRQAAAAQAITAQAASQALTQLETHLGVRLFHRTTRQLSLTQEGAQFLEAAQPGLAQLQCALHGTRPRRWCAPGRAPDAQPTSMRPMMLRWISELPS